MVLARTLSDFGPVGRPLDPPLGIDGTPMCLLRWEIQCAIADEG